MTIWHDIQRKVGVAAASVSGPATTAAAAIAKTVLSGINRIDVGKWQEADARPKYHTRAGKRFTTRTLRPVRLRLIDDWRRGWRFWSVRLQALALASGAALLASPDSAAHFWASIPPELRALVPASIGHWLPIVFSALAMLARFIKQDAKAKCRG